MNPHRAIIFLALTGVRSVARHALRDDGFPKCLLARVLLARARMAAIHDNRARQAGVAVWLAVGIPPTGPGSWGRRRSHVGAGFHAG